MDNFAVVLSLKVACLCGNLPKLNNLAGLYANKQRSQFVYQADI
jgi:hypothetical protein